MIVIANIFARFERLIKFAIVGCVNTLLSLVTIYILLSIGIGDILANMIGFLAGLALSFTLNRRWTFGHATPAQWQAVGRYIIVFLGAYAMNLLVVMAARRFGLIESLLSHLAGMGMYSVLFYLGCAHFALSGAGAGLKAADAHSACPSQARRTPARIPWQD